MALFSCIICDRHERNCRTHPNKKQRRMQMEFDNEEFEDIKQAGGSAGLFYAT